MGFLYYYISCLSGIVELGSVFWGLSKGFSVFQIVILVTAYQMGNLVQYFIPKKIERYSSVFLGVSLASCISCEFVTQGSTAQYVLAIITFFVGSTFLQLEREAVKVKVEEWEKWKKRAWRVVGFFLASSLNLSFGTWILAAIILSLLIIGIFAPSFGYDEWLKEFCNKSIKKTKICYAMITHQAHYFVYTYVLCMIVCEKYNSALIASIWFVLNWIPYTITEPLVKVLKIEKYYKYIGIGAHVFNGLVLLGVYFFLQKDLILFAVLLWMLTGFGGGNIYCVKKGMTPYVEYDNDTWMFSEQAGHILGMIVCIILVAIGKAELTVIAASLFALITVPIIIGTMLYHRKK